MFHVIHFPDALAFGVHLAPWDSEPVADAGV
jgi:hypothetical protein